MRLEYQSKALTKYTLTQNGLVLKISTVGNSVFLRRFRDLKFFPFKNVGLSPMEQIGGITY